MDDPTYRMVDEYLAITQMPVISRLLINGGTICIETARPLPSRFHRFWHWVLLGWTWEEIRGGK